MDGCRLARAPNKTHDREAVVGVGVEQILLVALGVGLCKSVGQPIVLLNQLLEQNGGALQDVCFHLGAFEHIVQLRNKVLQSGRLRQIGQLQGHIKVSALKPVA